MGHGDLAGWSSRTALGLMILLPTTGCKIYRLTSPEVLPDPKPKPENSKRPPPSSISESPEYNVLPDPKDPKLLPQSSISESPGYDAAFVLQVAGA